MRTTGILIFSFVFAVIVVTRSVCAFQSVKAHDGACIRIVAGLEKAKETEGDIVSALLEFTKNSSINRTSILAGDPIKSDHEKSVKLIDEQIRTIRDQSAKEWRGLSINLLFDTAALSALIVVIIVFVLPARRKRTVVKHSTLRKI